MKKLMLIVLMAVAANMCIAQTKPSSDNAVVKWEATTYDFGKIKQGVPVNHEFKFTNTGKIPFVMTNVQTTCGCTTPSWTRDPVLAGGEGHVKVTYNAAALGIQEKTITVYSNVEGGMVQLHIKAEVEAAQPAVKPN